MRVSENTKRVAFAVTSVYAAGSVAFSTLSPFFPPAQAQQVRPYSGSPSGVVQDAFNAVGGFFNVWQVFNHMSVTGSAATVTNCGLTPSIVGTDMAGIVTFGTGSPTTCSITFASAYVKQPVCSFDWVTNLALMNASVTTNAISLNQTSNSSSIVNYICIGQPGG